jgi:FKBP-type peptidyl-prolyl cis-trans isomerase
VIKGWDIGVATMARGEVARFIIAPEYAYGAKGFAPKVEPDETLDFEIELLRFKVRCDAPTSSLTPRG